MISQISGSEANFYAKALNIRTQNELQIQRAEALRPPDKNVDDFNAGIPPQSGRTTRAEFSAEELYRQLENLNFEGSAMNIMVKCIRIASRIMKGDNIPKRDDEFLFDNFPDMHLKAWMLRRYKAEPENHESLLDDEEEGVNVSFGGDGAEFDVSVAVEALDISV